MNERDELDEMEDLDDLGELEGFDGIAGVSATRALDEDDDEPGDDALDDELGLGTEDPMDALQEQRVSCPYCGERLELLLDVSAGSQTYVEDCTVCCRPITVVMTADGVEPPHVDVLAEDE